MFPVSALPTLNAILNFTAAVLLTAGYVFIKKRRIEAHKRCMIGALFVSVAFLTSYVIYHLQVRSVPFEGEGWIRPVYFFILISHIILAIVNLPLVLRTSYLGFMERYDKHVVIARKTFPIWMYVSVTGVIVYVMLYHL
jgi:putative membrane protein